MCIKPNPKIGKLNNIGFRKQRRMHTIFEMENLYYFGKHNIGHIEFFDILYSARRHPTKLSEAYPSPYICRYALRRRRDLDLDFMDIPAIESIYIFYCHIVYLVCIMDNGY